MSGLRANVEALEPSHTDDERPSPSGWYFDGFGEAIDAVLALIPEGDGEWVTEETLAAGLLDPHWQVAFHRWMTVGWSNTKNDEALPLARKLIAILAKLREAS